MNDFSPRQFARLDVRGGKSRDAPGELGAVRITDPDDVAGGEASFALFNARGQEAPAALPQRLFRAVVHRQRSFWMMEESNPALAPLELVRLRHEERAFLLALEDASQHGLLETGGNDQRDAGAHDDFRRLDLGTHPADGGDAGRSPRQLFEV